MRGLRKLLLLSPAERRLLVEVSLVLGVISLGLRVLPLGRVRIVIANAIRWTSTGVASETSFPGRAGWAVTIASQYVPGATCLARALAMQVTLQRRGYLPDVRIGLTRGSRERVEGHAWVEHEGRVIFGHGFSPQIVLPTLGGTWRHGE